MNALRQKTIVAARVRQHLVSRHQVDHDPGRDAPLERGCRRPLCAAGLEVLVPQVRRQRAERSLAVQSGSRFGDRGGAAVAARGFRCARGRTSPPLRAPSRSSTALRRSRTECSRSALSRRASRAAVPAARGTSAPEIGRPRARSTSPAPTARPSRRARPCRRTGRRISAGSRNRDRTGSRARQPAGPVDRSAARSGRSRRTTPSAGESARAEAAGRLRRRRGSRVRTAFIRRLPARPGAKARRPPPV